MPEVPGRSPVPVATSPTRALWLFSLVAVGLVVLGVAVYLRGSYRNEVALAEREAQNTAQRQAVLLADQLHTAAGILRQLELKLNVQRMLGQDVVHANADLLRNYRSLLPNTVDLVMLDAKGRVIATSNSLVAEVPLDTYCPVLAGRRSFLGRSAVFSYDPQPVAQCPPSPALVVSHGIGATGESLWLFLLPDLFGKVLREDLRQLSGTAVMRVVDRSRGVLLSYAAVPGGVEPRGGPVGSRTAASGSGTVNLPAMAPSASPDDGRSPVVAPQPGPHDAVVAVAGTDLDVVVSYSIDDVLAQRWWPHAEIAILSALILLGGWVLISFFVIRLARRYQASLQDSEQHYRTLANSGSALIWTSGLDKKAHYFNDVWLRFTGRTLDQELDDGWLEGVHPDDAETCIRTFVACFERQEPFTIEYRLRHADGSYHWILDQASPRYDAQGQFIGYIGFGYDITARKEDAAKLEAYRTQLEHMVEERTRALAEATEKLRVSEERYAFAIDATRDGIWDWNLETNTSYVSPAYAQMLGFEMADFGGDAHRHWIESLHPDERDEVQQQIRRQLDETGSYAIEFRMRCKDGRYKWILSRGEAVARDAQGRVRRAVGTHIDLTERKLAELELQQAKEAAEAANLAKSAFLANMSHEIRTPLNAITGMAYLIRRSGVSPEQQARLDKLEQAGRHLLAIVDAVLDLSKIEAGKFSLDEVPLRLDEVVGGVAAMVAERAQAKRLAIDVDIGADPGELHGDRGRIQQALLNYLTNAIKFTETGSVSVRADIVEDGADTCLVRFEVADTGMGIDADALPRLFRPFEQADNSITRRFGGTGLGLAITRRIAELMGGSAGASSDSGRGSRFWFTARLKKHAGAAAAPGATDTDGAPAVAAAAGVAVAAAPATAAAEGVASQRILLAEDDAVNREVTVALLIDAGIQVDVAVDGGEAVRMAGARDYALVLMDIQMPVLDGISATLEIRRLPGRRTVPILAMTANAFAEDRARCLAAGMDDFIAKPVEPRHLFAVLQRWMPPGSVRLDPKGRSA